MQCSWCLRTSRTFLAVCRSPTFIARSDWKRCALAHSKSSKRPPSRAKAWTRRWNGTKLLYNFMTETMGGRKVAWSRDRCKFERFSYSQPPLSSMQFHSKFNTFLNMLDTLNTLLAKYPIWSRNNISIWHRHISLPQEALFSGYRIHCNRGSDNCF